MWTVKVYKSLEIRSFSISKVSFWWSLSFAHTHADTHMNTRATSLCGFTRLTQHNHKGKRTSVMTTTSMHWHTCLKESWECQTQEQLLENRPGVWKWIIEKHLEIVLYNILQNKMSSFASINTCILHFIILRKMNLTDTFRHFVVLLKLWKMFYHGF